MSDWSAQKLQHFCMLSQGCDPNKKKMDVQRLHKLLSSAKNDDIEQQASPLVRAHFLQEVVDPVKQQRVSFHFMNNAIAVKVTERPTQPVKTELVSLSSENKENIPVSSFFCCHLLQTGLIFPFEPENIALAPAWRSGKRQQQVVRWSFFCFFLFCSWYLGEVPRCCYRKQTRSTPCNVLLNQPKKAQVC